MEKTTSEDEVVTRTRLRGPAHEGGWSSVGL